MSKAAMDPHGYKDWTLKTSIESQLIESLRVDIVAQSIPTLGVDIKAQSLGNINVNIASSAVTLNVAIQSSAVTLNVAIQSSSVTLNVAIQSSAVTLNTNIVNEALPTGQVKPTLSLDGENDYIEVPDAPSLNPDVFTVSLWIRPILPHGGTSTNAVINKAYYASPPNGKGWYIRFYGSTSLTLQFGVYFNDLESRIQYTITADWHHVAAVYDGAGLKLYVDGVLRDTAGRGTTYQQPTGINLRLGTPGAYHGFIDEVRFYSRALTAEEVAAEYTNPHAPNTLKLAMWLPLDEGIGTIVKDKSGNNNNGTICGATWISRAGSAAASVNVNITAQSISTLNVNIEAQAVDVKIVTPSGKAVSIAETIAAATATTQVSVPAGQEVNLLSLTGRGRLISLGLIISGVSDTIGAGSTCLRIYVDGALKISLSTYELDRLNGALLRHKLAAVSTMYVADVLNPRGGLTWCRTPSGSYIGWRECGVVLNPDVEFTSSLQVKVYQAPGYGDVNVWATILYGTYV